tara:strand:- start:2789 stop:3532 length:744 start_codon:yes stop_codon:yes gene_type:complete
MYTGNEMGDELLLRLDRMSIQSSRGYEYHELSSFLNRAQYSHVISVLTGLNPRMESFEETELRSQGLSELVKEDSKVPTGVSNLYDNSYLVELPSDFWLFIAEKCIIDKNLLSTETPANLKIEPKSHNEFNKQEKNPFRKPYFNGNEGLIWRIQHFRVEDGYEDLDDLSLKRITLITDSSFSPVTYNFRYLRKPPKIVVDFDTTTNQRNCVLNTEVQDTIIDLAAKMIKTTTDRQEVNNLQPYEKLT